VVANPPGSTTDFSDPFWSEPRQWQVLSANSLAGSPTLGVVSTDSSGRPAAPFGSFALSASATSVTLAWTPSSDYDRWTYEQFGDSWNNSGVSAPDRDPDGDGQDNRSEWIFGTAASDPGSRFVAAIGPAGLSIHRVAGRMYVIEYSTNPDGPWHHHAAVPAGTGPVMVAIDTGTAPRRFFRARVSFDP
jgi:hypothetical protein